MIELLRKPMRIRVIGFFATGVLVCAVAWYIGLDLSHAVIAGLAVLVVGVAVLSLPELDTTWWARSDAGADDGARNDVTRLSWSLRTRRWRVRPDAVRRVRTLAASRLSALGLDLDDPADQRRVEQRIGARAYRTLRPEPVHLPFFGDIQHTLDALDTLYTESSEPTTESIT